MKPKHTASTIDESFTPHINQILKDVGKRKLSIFDDKYKKINGKTIKLRYHVDNLQVWHIRESGRGQMVGVIE